MSKSHCKSRVVFVVDHSQKCAAVVPATGGGMQEEGNGDATTEGGDGEVFTASSWTVGRGKYSVEGRKQITVRLAFFPSIFFPLPFLSHH